jgi:hypothetical protein
MAAGSCFPPLQGEGLGVGCWGWVLARMPTQSHHAPGRYPINLTQSRHVWTAPSRQGHFDVATVESGAVMYPAFVRGSV